MAKTVFATKAKKQRIPKTIKAIVSGGKELIPGQKVLIYTPTNSDIVSSTGKVIGKKENIIGTGIVRFEDDQLVISSSKIDGVILPVTSKRVGPYAKSYRPTRNKYGWKRTRAWKMAVPSKVGSILVKPIDD